MKKNDHILLYVPEDKTKNITIAIYEKWNQSNKSEIGSFIYERLYRRYIKPFEFDDEKYKAEYKNGFSVMASCCLLIETLESFFRGWGNTSRKSELAFLKFFTREKEFKQFSQDDIPSKFYKNIRCGILHQGETTGGWKITRDKSKPLLSKAKKEINANTFRESLKKSLSNYQQLLADEEWNSFAWKNFRKKMKVVIKNCQ